MQKEIVNTVVVWAADNKGRRGEVYSANRDTTGW